MISGAETSFLTALEFGARASISQGSTVYPQLIHALQTAHERGDTPTAFELQHTINALVDGIRNVTQFFKLLLRDLGYRVQPHVRNLRDRMYFQDGEPLASSEYGASRELLEKALTRHGQRLPKRSRNA